MLKGWANTVIAKLNTPSGKNMLTFAAFVCLSAILWAVLVLNEDAQHDMRCRIRVTHLPDSTYFVSEIPDVINVSVRAQGSQMLRYRFTGAPTIDIDYRTYHRDNHISIGETELRSLIRTQFGADAQLINVTPDSINYTFTDRAPIKLPVTVDAKITTNAKYTLSAAPEPLTDSVSVYSALPLNHRISTIYTEPIRYDNINKPEVIRVKLIAPAGCRVEPNEIDVKLSVESLISKSRKVMVSVINAPVGMTITTFPPVVEVTYMVPMSLYNKIIPEFVVEADFRDCHSGSDKLPLMLRHIPKEFKNVYMHTDSVTFVVEQK